MILLRNMGWKIHGYQKINPSRFYSAPTLEEDNYSVDKIFLDRWREFLALETNKKIDFKKSPEC